MATSQPAANTSLRSSRRNFRRILHPDMTPMVGLGFLLVTFFLLAADFKKPTVLDLMMPVSRTHCDPPIDRSSSATTLVLGKSDKVLYYNGMLRNGSTPDVQVMDFSSTSLRHLLLKLKQEHPNYIVLIKPSDKAKYRNIVDALDEMNITGQTQYALVDMQQGDYDLLKRNGL
ncbi:ExbD/TolR family protein [Hymenobacter lucidus]|uniref:Biopolymer transporter ExbD n=1 Tax=Hymenobacter lucidus TaxID=2880930 RepID=A0ABS8ALN1_9BACT|nr:biopolymer transporter ExbD [Hymenobacter lucidus]MCB2406639.1 biopolymer transporter ExbD [Hymenobacter lucidus]